jgi:hypothetical protein
MHIDQARLSCSPAAQLARPSSLAGLAKILAKPLILGAVSALCLQSGARAAERIIIRNSTTQQTFAVENIETFTQTGQATTPEMRAFFEQYPTTGRLLQQLFNAQIYISPEFAARIGEKVTSPTADFILIQINKLISDPAVPNQIEPLKVAIARALRDNNRISLFEIVRNYPKPEIRLDVTDLEPVFNEVKGFVERVLPALEVARSYLQNIICDCNRNRSAQGTNSSATAGLPVSAAPCTNQSTAATPIETAEPAALTSTTAPQVAQPEPAAHPRLTRSTTQLPQPQQ